MSAQPTSNDPDDLAPPSREPIREMEIGGPSVARRIRGWIAYVAIFASVAAVLTWMFTQFSVPWRIALAIVVFMVGYMSLTAWWSSRADDRLGSMR